MPYCPKCRYEYYEGVDVCHDCGSKLTDVLPEEIDPSDIKIKWKALNILSGRIYAEMAKEVFDKKGIPSLVKSTFFSSAYGTRGISGDPTTIFVPEEKYEECQEIIKQMFDNS